MLNKLTPLFVAWAISAVICVFGASTDVAPNAVWVGLFLAMTGGVLAGLIVAPEVSSRVDPWRLQRNLMAISSQTTPVSPTLTKGSLLYYALQLEETAEQARSLVAIMKNHLPPQDVISGYEGYRHALQLGEPTIRQLSVCLRSVIAHCPDDWGLSLSRSEAKALLDDHIDVMVVSSGFGLATGLPGPQGYEAVQRSNLSKANPHTGMIDKDPSGKWIKGAEYQPPQLDSVLEECSAKPVNMWGT